MKTGLITSDTYQNHNTGDGHPEKIDRVTVVIDNFKKLDNKNLIWKKPNKFDNSFLIKTHTSNYIDQINKVIKKISAKNKSKYKIEYRVSGEAFLTNPNKTTFMIQDIIKKVTKIKPQLSTTGGTSDARFIRKIAPCLEFGLVGKTMHKIDEAVSLSDLKKLTLIYLNILKNYFK